MIVRKILFCKLDLHPDFEAWFGSGIIPGGDYIGGGPEDFEKFMDECSNAFQRTPVEYKVTKYT